MTFKAIQLKNRFYLLNPSYNQNLYSHIHTHMQGANVGGVCVWCVCVCVCV